MRGTLNQKAAIRLLEDNGWTRTKGGKHQVKMVKEGVRPITLLRIGAATIPEG